MGITLQLIIHLCTLDVAIYRVIGRWIPKGYHCNPEMLYNFQGTLFQELHKLSSHSKVPCNGQDRTADS